MKKISFIIGIFLVAVLSITLAYHAQKAVILGYVNQSNTNRQNLSILTTTDATTTTIKTLTVPTPTSTVHILANVIANGTTSTIGAAWFCQGDFKLSITSTVLQIGSTSCTSNIGVTGWTVAFATSAGSVLLNVSGNATNNINWQAFTELYSVQ